MKESCSGTSTYRRAARRRSSFTSARPAELRSGLPSNVGPKSEPSRAAVMTSRTQSKSRATSGPSLLKPVWSFRLTSTVLFKLERRWKVTPNKRQSTALQSWHAHRARPNPSLKRRPATAAVTWPLQAPVASCLPRPSAICLRGRLSSNVRPHRTSALVARSAAKTKASPRASARSSGNWIRSLRPRRRKNRSREDAAHHGLQRSRPLAFAGSDCGPHRLQEDRDSNCPRAGSHAR